LTAFIGTFAQFQIAALAYKLIPALKLTVAQFASILSAPMLPAIFLSVIAGIAADRFGTKKVVTVGFICAVAGMFLRVTATGFWAMLIFMLMGGMASALINANISKLLGAWFPPDQMGTAVGAYLSAGSAGMAIALATTAMFPSTNSAFITAGVIGLLFFILWVTLVKDKPEGAPDLPAMPVLKYIGVAAKSRSVWLVGVAMMCYMGAAMAFTGFLPNALHVVHGISPVTAGVLASIVTFGNIAGSLFGPVLSARLGVIKPVVVTLAILGAAAMYYSWIAPQGAAMDVLLFATGVLMVAVTPMLMAFPMLLPEIGPVYAGSAGGLIATLMLLGAYIPAFVIAPLAGQNFTTMFALSAVSLALVAVVALFLPELGAKARAKAAAKDGGSVA
jgi:nitrate/nitrite transporter NarK